MPDPASIVVILGEGAVVQVVLLGGSELLYLESRVDEPLELVVKSKGLLVYLRLDARQSDTAFDSYIAIKNPLAYRARRMSRGELRKYDSSVPEGPVGWAALQ
jgi:hypothetical protein